MHEDTAHVLILTLYLYKASSLESSATICPVVCSFLQCFPLSPLASPREQTPYAFTFHLSKACRDFPVTPSAPSVRSANKSLVAPPPSRLILPHRLSTVLQIRSFFLFRNKLLHGIALFHWFISWFCCSFTCCFI